MEEKSEGAELEQWENKMRKSHRLTEEGEGGKGGGREGGGGMKESKESMKNSRTAQ